MEQLFRLDNTDGYTAEQLNELNAEWWNIVSHECLDEYIDGYAERAKQFTDEVSRR